MNTLLTLSLMLTPAADPAAIAAEIAAANLSARISAANADARTPRDDSTSEVVTLSSDGWLASYKGRTTLIPLATPRDEVRRLAGEFGRSMDTPKTAPVYQFTPFGFTPGGS